MKNFNAGFFVILLLLSVPPAQAIELDGDRLNWKTVSSDDLLKNLRALKTPLALPSKSGFSPAKPIALAPPSSAHDYTMAYKSASGCVVFFLPESSNLLNISLKWNGPTCKGKPLSGKGILQILSNRLDDNGTRSIITTFNGQFEQGMFTGIGEKANFWLDANDGLLATYRYKGQFSNGILHGLGSTTYIGNASSQPSAWLKQGQFNDGIPFGKLTLARLNPYPGVEADVGEMIFNNEGQRFYDQSSNNAGTPVNGVLFFNRDTSPWETMTANTDKSDENFKPQLSLITRSKHPSHQANSVFYAACNSWVITESSWSCESGLFGMPHSKVGPLKAENTAFQFNIPIDAKTWLPLQVKDGSKLMFGLDSKGEKQYFTCNSSISYCTGRTIINIERTPLYWWGDVVLDTTGIKPVSARLMTVGNDKKLDIANNLTLATCTNFDNPTTCREGSIFYQNDGSRHWEGGFRLDGIAFEERGQSGSRLIATNAYQVLKEGRGKVYYRNGWASVMTRNDKMVEVFECDIPEDDDSFTCELTNGEVEFIRKVSRRNSRSNRAGDDSPRAIPVEPLRLPDLSPGSGGFEPTPIPQRSLDVLPGMQ